MTLFRDIDLKGNITSERTVADSPEEVNAETLRLRLDGAIVQLEQAQTAMAAANPTATVQRDAIRLCIKVCLALARLVIRRVESS